MSQTADGYGEFFMIEVESTCEFPLLLDRQGFLCLLLELFRSSRSRPVTLLRLQRPGKTFEKGASCKCDPNISSSLVSSINRSVGIPPLIPLPMPFSLHCLNGFLSFGRLSLHLHIPITPMSSWPMTMTAVTLSNKGHTFKTTCLSLAWLYMTKPGCHHRCHINY